MTSIIHDSNNQCFRLSMPLAGGGTEDPGARLDYVFPEKTVIDFNHTYVPFALRGKGLAEALVDEGLRWARQQGYSISASCPYVAKFLD